MNKGFSQIARIVFQHLKRMTFFLLASAIGCSISLMTLVTRALKMFMKSSWSLAQISQNSVLISDRLREHAQHDVEVLVVARVQDHRASLLEQLLSEASDVASGLLRADDETQRVDGLVANGGWHLALRVEAHVQSSEDVQRGLSVLGQAYFVFSAPMRFSKRKAAISSILHVMSGEKLSKVSVCFSMI